MSVLGQILSSSTYLRSAKARFPLLTSPVSRDLHSENYVEPSLVAEQVQVLRHLSGVELFVAGAEVGHLVLEHLAVIQGENKGRDPDCLVRG